MAQESTIKKIAIGVAILVLTAVVLKLLTGGDDRPATPPGNQSQSGQIAAPGTVYVAPKRDTVVIVHQQSGTSASDVVDPGWDDEDDRWDEPDGGNTGTTYAVPVGITGTWQGMNGAAYVIQEDGQGGLIFTEWFAGAQTAGGFGSRMGSQVDFTFENMMGVAGNGVMTIAPDGSFLDVAFTDPITGVPQSNRLFRQ